MVDYSKKTVAELTEILKSRSLPHSGKKAELVARLNEADKSAEETEADAATSAEATSAPPVQQAEPAPAPAPKSTPEKAAPAEAASAEVAPATGEEDSPANTDTALADSAAYSLQLPQSDIDSEMAKRKARAERFGTGAAAAVNGETGENGTDGDAQKALDRARRFGTGQTAMGKLDEALPEERERGSRKRGRAEEASAMDDPALRKGFGGRGGRLRGRGGRDGRDGSRRRTGEKPTGVSKQAGAFSSEADRLAADARKKKYASAS